MSELTMGSLFDGIGGFFQTEESRARQCRRAFMRMTSMKAATQETFGISRHGSLSTMAVRCWSKNPLTSAARTESI